MLRCAKQLKLKARAVTETWSGLARLSLPAIIQRRDDTFVIARKIGAESLQALSNNSEELFQLGFVPDWTCFGTKHQH